MYLNTQIVSIFCNGAIYDWQILEPSYRHCGNSYDISLLALRQHCCQCFTRTVQRLIDNVRKRGMMMIAFVHIVHSYCTNTFVENRLKKYECKIFILLLYRFPIIMQTSRARTENVRVTIGNVSRERVE